MRRRWPSERTWWKGQWVRITWHFALSCFLKFKDTAKAAQVEAVQLSLLFRVRCAGHAAVKEQADEKFFTTCDLVINLRPDTISTPWNPQFYPVFLQWKRQQLYRPLDDQRDVNWRRSLQDVRVKREADFGSNHYLVKATLKLRLRGKTTVIWRQKLKEPTAKGTVNHQRKGKRPAMADAEKYTARHERHHLPNSSSGESLKKWASDSDKSKQVFVKDEVTRTRSSLCATLSTSALNGQRQLYLDYVDSEKLSTASTEEI